MESVTAKHQGEGASSFVGEVHPAAYLLDQEDVREVLVGQSVAYLRVPLEVREAFELLEGVLGGLLDPEPVAGYYPRVVPWRPLHFALALFSSFSKLFGHQTTSAAAGRLASSYLFF